MKILRGENCFKFRLLTWTLLIGQFVHPDRKRGGDGKSGWMRDILAKSFTIRVDDNLV